MTEQLVGAELEMMWKEYDGQPEQNHDNYHHKSCNAGLMQTVTSVCNDYQVIHSFATFKFRKSGCVSIWQMSIFLWEY
jgi:hypothetical protein